MLFENVERYYISYFSI